MISPPLDKTEESIGPSLLGLPSQASWDRLHIKVSMEKKHSLANLLQHTPKKLKQIDYSLTYNANQDNPLIWLWNNYNLHF